MPRREQERRCLNCGTPLGLELGFSSFCSASCVWEGERLRTEATKTIEALRAEVEQQRESSRGRSLFGRLRGRLELDEDAAAVVALRAAGATVRQISRYTALAPDEIEKLLVSADEAREARRQARDRVRARAEREARRSAAARSDAA